MSRTRQSGASTSPVKKYLSFSGSKGEFKYYDKENPNADEKGNVYVPELKITVLDIKSSISGYNENTSSGISSNLLNPYDVGKVPFVVKTKVDGSYGVFAEGIYKDIKAELSTINAKFTTNVFGLVDLGNGHETVRLELNGSALSPWIELLDGLSDNNDIYDLEISAKRGALLTRKGGKTVKVTKAEYNKVKKAIEKDPMNAQRPVWFYAPEFSTEPLSEQLSELAVQTDEILQAYFDSSNGVKAEQDETSPEDTQDFGNPMSKVEPVGVFDNEDDDLPF